MSNQIEVERTKAQSLTQSGQLPTVAPACDVYENQHEFLVIADVPGVEPSALRVHIEKGELLVEARRELSAKAGTLRGAEWSGCEFRRRFSVPSGIDAAKISAELRDGVMHLHLPKAEALKPRQIPVRAG